jgi:hypothetical protein
VLAQLDHVVLVLVDERLGGVLCSGGCDVVRRGLPLDWSCTAAVVKARFLVLIL